MAGLIGCYAASGTSQADRAEQLTRESRYEEAIAEYQLHIESRLADSARQDWENPYFYLLSIADLELELGRPENALQSCLQAHKQGIDPGLISDRIRTIAAWHRERGESQAAFEVLKNHRELDPLLFDALLDSLGRELISKELPTRIVR